MPRKIKNWVAAFEKLTAYTGSPARLRRWAGISCLAGALEQKTWVVTNNAPLYPNLYTIFVAPPGIGKSAALNQLRAFWMVLKDHRLAASSVSKASLIDELADAQRTLIQVGRNPPTVEFHSLKVIASELTVFIPEFATEFMSVMTNIYDTEPFSERKRSVKGGTKLEIARPQINFVAGTTPSSLVQLLPEGAWDQGFLSRTLLVYDADVKVQSLFGTTTSDKKLLKEMEDDIREIGNLYGEMKFTPEAADFIDQWHMSGKNPVPNHPKLQHYLSRRTAHLLKLSQVACVSEANELTITVEHIQQAMDWLFDLEAHIPEIFKAMSNGGDAKVMDEAWHMLFQFKARHGKGAPRALLIQFISARVPSHAVERIIDLMEKGDMIRAVAEKNVGTLYMAKERSPY
jgi:Protein of unknown function (DUF3987)